MKSKEILPEIVRDYFAILEAKLEPSEFAMVEKALSALSAAEQEIEDKEIELVDQFKMFDDKLREKIIKIQDLEKEIKGYMKLAESSLPELKRKLQKRK